LPILTIFLISGCATTKNLEIFTKEVERMPLDLELPPVVVLEKINWKIISEGNQEEVFAELKKANIDPVLFALTDEDYELLQKNNVQLRNIIMELRARVEAYKAYYEPEEQEGKNNSIIKPSNFEPKKLKDDE
tara:strand:- start:135 stop:533 length:399 start_codon:yes stop_codon:yes gene_type:complete